MLQLALLLIALQGKDPTDEGFLGTYVCTIEAQATLVQSHIPPHGPPFAMADNEITYQFAIEINESPDSMFSIRETSRDGLNFTPHVSLMGTALLHEEYVGDGSEFRPVEGLGFMLFSNHSPNGWAFYHSGPSGIGVRDFIVLTSYGHCQRIAD
jgi:hypothetical protein